MYILILTEKGFTTLMGTVFVGAAIYKDSILLSHSIQSFSLTTARTRHQQNTLLRNAAEICAYECALQLNISLQDCILYSDPSIQSFFLDIREKHTLKAYQEDYLTNLLKSYRRKNVFMINAVYPEYIIKTETIVKDQYDQLLNLGITPFHRKDFTPYLIDWLMELVAKLDFTLLKYAKLINKLPFWWQCLTGYSSLKDLLTVEQTEKFNSTVKTLKNYRRYSTDKENIPNRLYQRQALDIKQWLKNNYEEEL